MTLPGADTMNVGAIGDDSFLAMAGDMEAGGPRGKVRRRAAGVSSIERSAESRDGHCPFLCHHPQSLLSIGFSCVDANECACQLCVDVMRQTVDWCLTDVFAGL